MSWSTCSVFWSIQIEPGAFITNHEGIVATFNNIISHLVWIVQVVFGSDPERNRL